jgi:hypothetical protein
VSDGQFTAALLAIFLILAVTIAAHLKWVRGDSVFGRVVIFLAGAAAMVLLGIMKVPPQWFDGGKTGVILGVSFCIGAFLGRKERWFRIPLLLGLGLPLLVFNFLAHL